MRVGIFYFSLNNAADRWPVHIPVDDGLRPGGYVRVEEVDAPDLLDALDRATPRVDEHVMNTHALDGAVR